MRISTPLLLSVLLPVLALLANCRAPAEPSLRDFPKPSPDRAFADLKLYDAAGRPWRAAREDWPGAQQRVAADPAWAAWLAKERGEVDAWKAKHSDRLAWTCGWWHDFVSPKDGSKVVWEDAVPGEEARTLHSDSDAAIAVTPKLLGGWVFLFRSKHLGMIQRAARLYRLTGEAAYAEWAMAQVDFYADAYLQWPASARGDGARMFWQTLDEATALATCADAVRVLGERVAPERRARWWSAYFAPQSAVLLHGKAMQKIHNIALWHRSGVAQIAMVYGDEALFHEAVDGPLGFRSQIERGVTSDYLEWEQSFGYNGYFVQAASGLFVTAGLLGRAEEFAREQCIVENLLLSPLYVRFPDGNLPLTADVIGRIIVPERKAFAESSRIFPTRIGQREAATRRDWRTLLDPPEVWIGIGGGGGADHEQLPPVTPRLLESSRMAVLRAGAWQVFVQFGQLTEAHSQEEALNFMAYHGDTDVTHDAGTVGYGSPLHRGYYTLGIAHNVPLVDGLGMAPKPQYGELISYKEDRIEVGLPEFRPGAWARRVLAINDGRLEDTLSIGTTDGAEHRLGFALHLQGKVDVARFVADPHFAEGRPVGFQQLGEAMVLAGRDAVEVGVDYGAEQMVVRIEVPGEFRVWRVRSLDLPPAKRDCLYVERVGKEVVFRTVVTPVVR